MPGLRLDSLRLPRTANSRLHSRLWREWCFWRVMLRRFAPRFALIGTVLLVGALLFLKFDEKPQSFFSALFCTWSLIFGQPPEDFPNATPLRLLYFIVPVIGLTFILEALVEFALLLRDRRRYDESWCQAMAAALSNHIVLVGMGRLGYRTFDLLRRLGESVVVIERDENNQFLSDVRRAGFPLLIHDARRETVLLEAGIERARSIIVSTDDDLANLEIALDARRFNPRIRVVLRLFDQNMADKIRDGFNIRLAMSQAAISAPAFALAAVDATIVNTFVIENELVAAQWWHATADGPLVGQTIAQIMVEFNVSVLERKPRIGAGQLFPASAALVDADDRLLVQGVFERLLESQTRHKSLIAEVLPKLP